MCFFPKEEKFANNNFHKSASAASVCRLSLEQQRHLSRQKRQQTTTNNTQQHIAGWLVVCVNTIFCMPSSEINNFCCQRREREAGWLAVHKVVPPFHFLVMLKGKRIFYSLFQKLTNRFYKTT